MNWLDRLAVYVDPIYGARRMAARLSVTSFQKNEAGIRRALEGGKHGDRTWGWRARGAAATAESEFTLSTLRARHRDLCENNAWAGRAIDVLNANLVGEGIIPEIEGRSDRHTKLINDVFEAWSESLVCSSDERIDYYGIQALADRSQQMNGEVLLRRRWRRKGDSLAVPLQIQIIEADQIDTSKTYRESNGFFTIQGVRFSPLGKRVGYWLYDEHPGGMVTGSANQYQSRLVDASDIIHVFKVLRPGQVRGIPRGSKCILKLRDFDELDDAILVQQKIANMFTVFVTGATGSLLPKTEDEVRKATELTPGMIEYLNGNTQVTFANPPRPTGYRDFSEVSLYTVSAGFGVTFEQLTQNLSKVNFSSYRAGRIEFNMQVRQDRSVTFIPHVCEGLFQWFLEAAELAGYDTRGVSAMHTPPRLEYADPTKEIPADRDAIRAGIKTPGEVVRSQGKDFRKHLLEYKSDLKLIDELELTGLELDPRTVKQGAAAPATGEAGGDDEDPPSNDSQTGDDQEGNDDQED